MPGPSDIPVGNVSNILLLQATLSPAQLAASTTVEQTFAVGGLQVGDVILVQKPTAQAGVGIAGARVTAIGTLGITFVNASAGTPTPTAGETYIILVIRRENQNGLPTAIT